MPDQDPTIARRALLAGAGAGIAAAALSGRAAAQGSTPPPAPVDEGGVAADRVTFPAINADTDRPAKQPPNPDPPARRVGFAVMGLGRLSAEYVLPAFAQSKHARLAALVSGDAPKMRALAAQYGVPAQACYDYAGFDRIAADPGVEAVYVVLPNALHRDAVVRAARAGKHVLCEKPMATSPAECRDMIAACARAKRHLMVAYRCQYEVNNRDLARRARAGELGQVQLIDAIDTQNQGDPAQWRHRRALAGGGSLPDVGLYCLNTARALLGEEPAEVWATIHSPDDARFREVESTVSFTLRFPSGVIANCASSYSAHEYRNLRVLGSAASAEIENAFAYEGQRLRISRRDGRAEATATLALPRHDQFALELDHMAECVRQDRRPRTPGEEGLQDHVLMDAIYQSARTGRPVSLKPPAARDAFRGPEPSPAD